MTEISSLITLGVIIGVAILALKTGLGCGFANLRKREIVYVALIYFITSIALGYLVGVIPLNVTQNILAMGVTMRGNDLSRRTFLWLSVPCPVCLTATFLACLMLSRLTRISNLRIGFLVGVIFFIGVCLY